MVSYGYAIMGDMNARFGKDVRDLAAMYEVSGMDISYTVIDDDMGHMNDNAICMNRELAVLNNLKTPQGHFCRELMLPHYPTGS